MKKCLVIALMLLYTATSSGMTLYLHYCCGKLDTISVTTDKHNYCSEKEVEKEGCCESESVDLKLNTDQETTSKIFFNQNILTTAEATGIIGYNFHTFQDVNSPLTYQPHLKVGGTPIFIKNCVFRN